MVDLTLRPEDALAQAVTQTQEDADAAALAALDAGVEDGLASPAGAGGLRSATGGIFAQLGDESRLAAGLPVYRKLKLLGRGAFGKAYLVEGSRGPAQRHVRRVLKKLPLRGISEDRREGAFREALLMRRISRGCPFITQFSEVFLGKAGSILCLVMEFCSGGDLRSLVRSARENSQRIAEEHVLHWSSQVGLALRHCHANGVLHRDVKPENCFFRTPGGDLLLGDFGISCTLDEKSFAKTCVGSPLYLSPEIINQDRYSYATDVWSLGVMMYELTMLEPPFKGTNICQVAFKIVSAVPQPIDASFSEALRGMIGQLLDKDPAARPTLEVLLVQGTLAAAAQATCLAHSLEWPPPAGPGPVAASSRSGGLVQRLRSQTQRGAPVSPCGDAEVADEYEDDFEEYVDDFEGDEEDVVYDDDFEAMSAGNSEASYEQDFEAASDDEGQMEGRWNEESVRQQLHLELGSEGLAIAESLGVVSFLEGMRVSAHGAISAC
eukprot:TRINITY_DN64582_c0_g1_i1.p1 TRINITY_DN64582_c0_g1~~TRINITY_DN64582_c0_g1_i1.p1  ORF type:complete len:494 (+),score=129.09 TRINITY_DN64582_c0_g1_i1:54-1535(+)